MKPRRRLSSLKDPPTKTRKSLFSVENLLLFFALLVENFIRSFQMSFNTIKMSFNISKAVVFLLSLLLSLHGSDFQMLNDSLRWMINSSYGLVHWE